MPDYVIDTLGSRYTLGRRIGSGGQGAVYELKEGRFAVKLLYSRGDPEIIRRRIERVRRFDLAGIPLARPLAVLRLPHAGYVMELLKGTRALQTLLHPPTDSRSPAEWFLTTGGLRGRLRLLGRIARILSMLHGRGLAFGDLSPANVVVAGDLLEDFSVHLLDSDNIRSESLPASPAVFTNGYGAPELIRGTAGVTTLSDLFSFAVLAFECLSAVHPFVGDAGAEGDPELEEKAFAGLLPWIEDSASGNSTTKGVPRLWVLSEKIRELFACAFGVGRTDPGARPRAGDWAEVLEQAADMTLTCPRCKGTFFLRKDQPDCPWCNHSVPAHFAARFLLWDPGQSPLADGSRFVMAPGSGRPRVVAAVMFTAGLPQRVERRHLFSEADSMGADYAVQASLCYTATSSGSSCDVTNLSREPLRLVRYSSPVKVRTVAQGKTTKVGLSEKGEPSGFLHFGPPETLHRALRLGS
jgi:DNA-binding helix-hairpin-helix protein with protein kinase domain